MSYQGFKKELLIVGAGGWNLIFCMVLLDLLAHEWNLNPELADFLCLHQTADTLVCSNAYGN